MSYYLIYVWSIISIILPPTISYSHPVHLSMTTIIIDTKKQTFTIISKLQEHDLLDILNIKPPQTIELKNNHRTISDFFQKDFFIKQDKQILRYKLIAIEKEDNFVKLTFVGKLKNKNKSITIHNSLLIKYFKDQKNLAIISIDNKEQPFTFTNKITEKIIRL
jgi:hypothetical protein